MYACFVNETHWHLYCYCTEAKVNTMIKNILFSLLDFLQTPLVGPWTPVWELLPYFSQEKIWLSGTLAYQWLNWYNSLQMVVCQCRPKKLISVSAVIPVSWVLHTKHCKNQHDLVWDYVLRSSYSIVTLDISSIFSKSLYRFSKINFGHKIWFGLNVILCFV